MKTRRRRNNRRRRARTQKGGSFPKLRMNAIVWPPKEGCDEDPVKIVLNAGDIFDRFGPDTGSYVSPVDNTALTIAKKLQILPSNIKKIFTYVNRALPYAGVNSAGFENNYLRETLYKREASYGANVLGYHRYKIIQNNQVSGSACKAAPAFDTPGGAIQIKLDKSVKGYLEDGSIIELNVEPGNIPAYKNV